MRVLLERRRVRKQYPLETRCDVLIKNAELFAYGKGTEIWFTEARQMKPPRPTVAKPDPAELFVHMPAKLQKQA